MIKRLIASLICLTFSFSNIQLSQAQDFSIDQLPVPGTMVGISTPFAPLALKGLIINPQKPLEFQFIVDTGRGPQDTASIKDQANQLVKYFLAGLTIPEGDLWVNLSPYEKNRMVPEALGQTDLGRDLLAQDYILKQLTASLIYPEKDLGKEFWSRVYSKAQQQFGTTNVPVNTFNKVWVLPDQAQVYENNNAAYVTKSTLKVMLDEDYLALSKHQGQPGDMARAVSPSTLPSDSALNVKASQGNLQPTNTLASNIVRQIILPEIEKEVNTGKNFAPLRQIYQALILAKWYKETIQNGLLDAVYTNKNKIAGVNLTDPAIKEQIYDRYLQAYKKGAFNYIKEDPTPDGQVMPRKYFSGGTVMAMTVIKTHDRGTLTKILTTATALLLLIVSCDKSNEGQSQTTQKQGIVPTQTASPNDQQSGNILLKLHSLNKEDQLSALNDIKKLGPSAVNYIPEIVQYYRHLGEEEQYSQTDAIGETVFAMGGQKAFEAYIQLMQAADGRYNITFLRFIRKQIERGDDIIPLIVDTLLEQKEGKTISDALFVTEMMNFDKSIDYLMSRAAKGQDERDMVGGFMMNVLRVIPKMEGNQEILERARPKLIHYLENGTREQRAISTLLVYIRPVKTDTLDAFSRQIERETDPTIKEALIDDLKSLKDNTPSSSPAMLGQIQQNFLNAAMLNRSPEQKLLSDTSIFNLVDQMGYFKLEDYLWHAYDPSRLSNILRIKHPLTTSQLDKLYNDFTAKGWPIDDIQSIPFGDPKHTWSESWAFRLFLRKTEEPMSSNGSTKVQIGNDAYYVELLPEFYDQKMDETEAGLREQVKFGVILNATNSPENATDRKKLFADYFGQENADRYFEAIEAVRAEYQKETGSSAIILDGRTVALSKSELEKSEDQRRLFYVKRLEGYEGKEPAFKNRGDLLLFKERLTKALAKNGKLGKTIDDVIDDLKREADRLINANDFLVEYAYRNIHEGLWGYNTGIQILFLQQLKVGVVKGGIVEQIKNNTEYLPFPGGYEVGFQFNPARALREQTGSPRDKETLLAWKFVTRVFPLERVLPYQGHYFYNILPNPFPHLRDSINIVRQEHNLDHVPQQIADERSLEDMLKELKNFGPEKDQLRFRIFLNCRYSGLSYDHQHFQGFLQRTKVEEALTPDKLEPVELASSITGVEAFRPKKGAWWMDTALVLEGGDYKQMAAAIGSVLRRANDDGDVVVNLDSKFTYNILFTWDEASSKYKVFIFIRNLDPLDPKNPNEFKEKDIVVTDDETGQVLYRGRPATVEFADTIIWGSNDYSKAYARVVKSLDLPGKVLRAIADKVEYKGFDQLVNGLKQGNSWRDMVKSIDIYDQQTRDNLRTRLADGNLSYIMLNPGWDREHNLELLIALKRMGYEILGEAPWNMDLAKNQPQRFFEGSPIMPNDATKLYRNVSSGKLSVIFMSRAKNYQRVPGETETDNIAVMTRPENKRLRVQFESSIIDLSKMVFLTPGFDSPDTVNTVGHDLDLLLKFADENRGENAAMTVEEIKNDAEEYLGWWNKIDIKRTSDPYSAESEQVSDIRSSIRHLQKELEQRVRQLNSADEGNTERIGEEGFDVSERRNEIEGELGGVQAVEAIFKTILGNPISQSQDQTAPDSAMQSAALKKLVDDYVEIIKKHGDLQSTNLAERNLTHVVDIIWNHINHIERLVSQRQMISESRNSEIGNLISEIISGSFKLKGESVDVLRDPTAQEIETLKNFKPADLNAGQEFIDRLIIGSIDRNIAERLGYFHQTANAFIRTPDGGYLIQIRSPWQDFGLFESIYGGHMDTGKSHLDGVKKELREELNLAEGKELEEAPQFAGFDVYVGPKENNGKQNNEIRSIFEYRLRLNGWGHLQHEQEQLERARTAVIDKLSDMAFYGDKTASEIKSYLRFPALNINFPLKMRALLIAPQNEDEIAKRDHIKQILALMKQKFLEVLGTNAPGVGEVWDITEYMNWQALSDPKNIPLYTPDLLGRIMGDSTPELKRNIIQVNNRAMLHASAHQDNAELTDKGGIDLNQINVLQNGKTVNIQFDPAQLSQLMQGGFEGFSFKIESMTKISSPFQLLGINAPTKQLLLAKA